MGSTFISFDWAMKKQLRLNLWNRKSERNI